MCYFHTDAVQAAGKVALDVKRIACDMLSISGHKIHAPQGVGALYVRKGTILQPMLYGGTPRALPAGGNGKCAWTRSLGQGCQLAREGLDRGEPETMAALRDRLEQTILGEVEATGVNGEGAPRVPNTTNIHFDYIEGEALVIALDLKGLAVSTGAACSSGVIEPSHVLTAMGLRPGPGPRQPALQPGEAEHRGRRRFRPEFGSCNRRPPAGAVAGLQ